MANPNPNSTSGKKSHSNSPESLFRQEALERLSSPERLDQLMQIVSPRSWLPLGAAGLIVGVALLWSFLGRIPIHSVGEGILVYPDDGSEELVGITFFDQSTGTRIQPGMRILIVPASVAGDRAGGRVGTVIEVSEPPIRTLEMARFKQEDEPETVRDGRVEVIAEIETDPSSPDGYRWSAVGSSLPPLMAGTSTTGRITLEEKAPITFVLPFLE